MVIIVKIKKKHLNNMSAQLLLVVLLSLAATSLGGLVVQSHWEHVRLKALPPVRVDGREGGQVVLTCSATGSPAPAVAWYKDSLFVSHLDWSVEEHTSSMGETVARLTIPCLTASDVGSYECRARSGEREASATTQLNLVQTDLTPSCGADSDRPLISLWKKTYMVEEGQQAILTCRVKESQDIRDYRVVWTASDGQPAHGNDVRFKMADNGDLVIEKVKFADMGQYTCTVTGPGGSDSVHTFLYPLAPERNLSRHL